VAALIRNVPLEAEVASCRDAVFAEMTGIKSMQSRISRGSLIPHVPATQLALVEPHFNPGLAQRAADAGRCRGILRGVAEEYGGARTLAYPRTASTIPVPPLFEGHRRGCTGVEPD